MNDVISSDTNPITSHDVTPSDITHPPPTTRKQREAEQQQRARRREEKLRRREARQRARRRRGRRREEEEEEEAEPQPVLGREEEEGLEPRRLLLAQRNLQSVRLIAALLARAEVSRPYGWAESEESRITVLPQSEVVWAWVGRASSDQQEVCACLSLFWDPWLTGSYPVGGA